MIQTPKSSNKEGGLNSNDDELDRYLVPNTNEEEKKQ
jgi:hypothetical protein